MPVQFPKPAAVLTLSDSDISSHCYSVQLQTCNEGHSPDTGLNINCHCQSIFSHFRVVSPSGFNSDNESYNVFCFLIAGD